MGDRRIASEISRFGTSVLFGLAARLKPLPIGRISAPLLLLCFVCGGGRTGLTDAVVVDQTLLDSGLLASTPGQVRCGSINCGYGDHCCLRVEGRPASNGCDSRATATCNAILGTRVCDETADCNPGELCCWTLVTSPPPTIGSICVASNDALAGRYHCEYIACGSDDDCRAVGMPLCGAQQCRDDILQSCGLMDSGYCTP